MILYIDSTDFENVTYIVAGSRVFKKTFKVNPHQSHEVLAFLEKFLKLSNAELADLTKLVVNKGPGSYTGTRVGVTHGLALSFALKIPLRVLPKQQFELQIKKLY